MTTDRVFVDTNVLLYARDGRFPDKKALAEGWLLQLARTGRGVVSPQVLGEFHNAVFKSRLGIDPEEARQATVLLKSWLDGVTDLALIEAGWDLRKRTGFQWWDCVILAAASRSGCRYLLSEDYTHQRTVDGVTIICPFRTDPSTILQTH